MVQDKKINGVYIHPRSIVETADVGKDTRIWAFAHILEGAKIGEDCNICDHTFIESKVTIGNRVTIKCGVYLWDGLVVEDEVFIGPNATFTNDTRPRSKVYPEEYPQTLLKKGASIGANATIMCGITVGQYAAVGAGSIVTRDVPDFALVYGCPAQVKGHVCECYKDLNFTDSRAKCTCGKVYELKETEVVRIK